MNKKPKILLVLKIFGFIGVGISIAGVVLLITGFGNFESNNFLIGMFVLVVGFPMASICLGLGFKPEMAKLGAKTYKYIQSENKEDLKDIANTSAEIINEPAKTIASSIKEGLNQEKIYCKYCGEKIDINSKFCKNCGKELKEE